MCLYYVCVCGLLCLCLYVNVLLFALFPPPNSRCLQRHEFVSKGKYEQGEIQFKISDLFSSGSPFIDRVKNLFHI